MPGIDGGMESTTPNIFGEHLVHLVIYPGFKIMEAVGPLSVLGYANKHLAAKADSRGYKINVVAPMAGSVPSDMMMSLEAAAALPEEQPVSTVIIAGAADIETAIVQQPSLIKWCRKRACDADRFAALCTGSFFLAEAGLLEGRRAATHWNFASLLQRRFPGIQVDADAIFVQDGNLWTSAGVTAAIDLTLAFVEQDFGRDLALQVARDLVIYLKRPGGQSQFSAALTGQLTGSADIRDIQAWLMARLDQPVTVKDMAERARMSPRHFSRLFLAELGMTPSVYLENARCERAVTLLLDTDMPLKTVAFRAGFGTDERMRKVFLRKFSLTARDYRARFKTATQK